jgi:NAD(P)H-flavin reductase
MIETLVLSGASKHHKIYVYFGTRYVGDIFFDDKLNDYLNEGSISDYKIFLSRASMPGAIEGYVTQFIEMHEEESLYDGQFFICGNGAMIKDVEGELIKRGVPKSSIFYEKFY